MLIIGLSRVAIASEVFRDVCVALAVLATHLSQRTAQRVGVTGQLQRFG